MNKLKKIISIAEAKAISLFDFKVQAIILYFTRGHYTYSNFKMYQECASLLRLQGKEGVIFEFGVGSGMTAALISMAIKNNFKKIVPLFLFDTFEGMPQPEKDDENFQWVAGSWAFTQVQVLNKLKSHGISKGVINFFKGDYAVSTKSNSAIEALSNKALIVHIDCDYKSSAALALDYVRPALQEGSIILCDDYFCYSGNPTLGEAGALFEWAEKKSIKLRPWKPYSIHGQSFIVYQLS